MSVKENLRAFIEDLDRAANRYGRDRNDITVMAVSKTRTVDEIREAGEAGLALFGENRVEEASEKFAELEPSQFPLVLIGHLQSNKASRIDARYTAVHSIDSVKIAGKLSTYRTSISAPLEVLLQVNTSGEPSKSGFGSLEELKAAADTIAALPSLTIKGLMTMAPFVDDENIVRDCFAECRRWFEELNKMIGKAPILSMGMSSDYPWAVAEGSTMLRIGTTLFGAR